MTTDALPTLALSFRQPWAWAILHGGKVIENRSLGAIRAGRMVPGQICLHAARGMKRDEYDWAVWRLAHHGVTAPRPEVLVRGAIIGAVQVTGIITEGDSEWFGGAAGLTLAEPEAIDPIPSAGALGYFEWKPGGAFADPTAWMTRWDAPGGGTLPLFPESGTTGGHPRSPLDAIGASLRRAASASGRGPTICSISSPPPGCGQPR